MLFGLLLVPPALCPGQGFTAAGEPHLAAQQWGLQLLNLPGGVQIAAGVRSHGRQINGHRMAGEQLQVARGAAITQQP